MPRFYRDQERFVRTECLVLHGEMYDFTPCTYCGLPATDREHVIARARAAMIRELGLAQPHQFLIVPACRECNTLAGKQPFTTITEKRTYLHMILRKRYRKYLEMPLWTEEKFHEMSDGLIGMIRRAMAMRDMIKRRLAWPHQDPSKSAPSVPKVFRSGVIGSASARSDVEKNTIRTSGKKASNGIVKHTKKPSPRFALGYCLQCQQTLHITCAWKKFCSITCRWEYWDQQHPRQRCQKELTP